MVLFPGERPKFELSSALQQSADLRPAGRCLDYAARLSRGITAGFQPNVDAAFNNGRASNLQYGGGATAAANRGLEPPARPNVAGGSSR
jgi:hypothetical protein